jgi:hypothetical protein
MIRERPKSAMRRSESSAGVRKRRFSGFRSSLSGCLRDGMNLDGQFHDHVGMIQLIRLFERGLRHQIRSSSLSDIFYQIILPQGRDR